MSAAPKRYSIEEYEEFEATSDERHEYFDGEMFAMAGGSAKHNLISGNVFAELRNQLKGRCHTFGSDMKLHCPTGLRSYPDVSTTCLHPEYEDQKQVTLLNPQLVVEVLSKSTAAYDRGRKFINYQTIPSLRQVVFVDQDRVHVEVHTRQASGQWNVTTYSDLDATVELPAVECAVPMREVYFGIDFAAGLTE